MLLANELLGVLGRELDATDDGRWEVLWDETERNEWRAGSFDCNASAKALLASLESIGKGLGCEEADEEKERSRPPEDGRPGVGMPDVRGRPGVDMKNT